MQREMLLEVTMRSTVLALILAAGTAMPAAAAAGSRTLTTSVPAASLDRVSIEAGVGEVHVTGGSADEVQVTVVLTPRRGGLFSSLRRGEAEVAAATLGQDVEGAELHLTVNGPSDDRRFEEEWTVELPERLLIRVELGVGEASLRNTMGGVELHIGVGDGRIEALAGDVNAEVGVGDLTVRGPADAYGPVTCSSGVGDATIQAAGRTFSGGGFVGKSAEWRSTGESTMELETGVGDVEVTLTD